MTRVLGRVLASAITEVRVVGMYPADYPAPDYEEDNGVRVWRLRKPGREWGGIRSRYAIYRQAAEWARMGEIDIIEAPDYDGWTAGWPELPVPVVVRLHGSSCYFQVEMGNPVRPSSYHIERAALRRADWWCSVSQYTADRTRELFELPAPPRAILHNLVEPIDGEHAPVGERVLFSGTLVLKKGVVPLFHSWPAVRSRRPKAELHLYGKDGRTGLGGSMKEHLLSLLPESDRGSVFFHGHVGRDELYQAICQARVAVFPSYAEAFAIAPLEAMTTGCPTIYSTRGSGPELLEHGRQGLLVNPDAPVEISDAIVSVLSDEEYARRLGQAGRERVATHFSRPALLGKNIEFYQDCIDRFGARRGARARAA